MDNEELNRQFRIFEKQIIQIQSEIQAIEQATLDMERVKIGLHEIQGKVGSEILAPIGRGIFLKAKIVSDEPLVDIGNGNFIKKTISETNETINEQKDKLERMKKELENELDKIGEEITNSMEESKTKHEHCDDCECDEGESCGDDCECDDTESCGDDCKCSHNH